MDQAIVDGKLSVAQGAQPAARGRGAEREIRRSGRLAIGVVDLAFVDGFDFRGARQGKKTRVLKERLRRRGIELLRVGPLPRPTSETTMTSALPRDILNRVERRWTARVTQTESFHARTARLKQSKRPLAEGARPLTDEPEPPQQDRADAQQT